MLFYLWGVSQEEEEKKKLQDRIDNALKEIERLEKRNKEIYEGFMATTEELCEATKEIERLKLHIMKIKEVISTWNIENDEGHNEFKIPKKIIDVVWGDK